MRAGAWRPGGRTIHRSILAVTGAVALAAGLAACGSSPPKNAVNSPSPTTTASPAASPHPLPTPSIVCTIASANDVNTLLGTGVGAPTVQQLSPNETNCQFFGANQVATVDITVGENAAGFAADKQQFTAQEIWADAKGVGDQAYYLTKPSQYGTTTILVALKGTTSVIVSSQTSLASLEDLMNHILAKIPAS